jgi:predicted peroxiredoxin
MMAKVLVSTLHGLDNLEGFRLALEAVLGFQAQGDEVVLFCAGHALRLLRVGDAEAVSYGDEELETPGFRPIAGLLHDYLSEGGRVVGAAESAIRFGVTGNQLREGIELQPIASLGGLISEGFGVLTY